ncbi:MAG: glycosyltransferase family 39 protein [bacterium]
MSSSSDVNAIDPHAGKWVRALAVITIAAVIRLVFAGLIPVFPDEAYYWEWSRRLAPGYFDHPPGIAALIRLGGVLLAPFGMSATPLGVRLGPALAGWIAALGTIATARRLAGDAAAFRAAIILSVLPLAAAGLILSTPDSPLLAATAVALYALVRALQSPPRSADSLRWWAMTGAVLGLAFSSKYTSIFLPVAAVAAIAIRPDLRARFREPGPYVACAFAVAVFLPVLLWNSQHGWISFVFQVRHGFSASQGSALLAAWKHLGDFFGGQAALASPILFILLIIAVRASLTRRSDGARFVLGAVAALSFGFFVYSCLRRRVEPNWPAPAYIPAIVLLATMRFGTRGEKWLTGGIGLAAALTLVIYAQAVVPILPIPPQKDPIGRAFGWRELTARADSVAQSLSTETRATTWLGGDRYQEAAELALQSPSHPTTFALNLSGRENQYDLWPKFSAVARPGDNLLLVLDDSDVPHSTVVAVGPNFAGLRRGDLVTLRRGDGVIATRRIWLLVNWRGTALPQR